MERQPEQGLSSQGWWNTSVTRGQNYIGGRCHVEPQNTKVTENTQ